jgi:hypothetical protein
MKIEFVKETNLRGEVYYYTVVDGSYQSDTISSEYSQAYELFIAMKKRQEPTIEVLEHCIIEPQNK